MARGWESKAIEAQQDDAAARTTTARRPVSPDDAERDSKRATLLLARANALANLQQACWPAHRAMLEAAIADLDSRINAL